MSLILIFFAALLALNFGIPAYFASLPLIARFGRLICQELFGI